MVLGLISVGLINLIGMASIRPEKTRLDVELCVFRPVGEVGRPISDLPISCICTLRYYTDKSLLNPPKIRLFYSTP